MVRPPSGDATKWLTGRLLAPPRLHNAKQILFRYSGEKCTSKVSAKGYAKSGRHMSLVIVHWRTVVTKGNLCVRIRNSKRQRGEGYFGGLWRLKAGSVPLMQARANATMRGAGLP